MNLSSPGGRERMRHVPPIEYLTYKIDVDYRARTDKLIRAFDGVRERLSADEQQAVASDLLGLARSLERMCDLLRGGRATHHPEEIRPRLESAFANATQAILSVNPQSFQLRVPENQFERSLGEQAFGAFLVITDHVKRATETVASVAPGVWETLLSGTVQQEHPVNEETLQPIA